MNTILKVFSLFDFSCVCFLYLLLGPRCQKNECDFAAFYGQKNNMANMPKLGCSCTNGFIAWKQLKSAEGCMKRKCTVAGDKF